MRRATAVAAVVALAFAAPGCRDAPAREPRVVVETTFLERLSGAISDVNAARQRLAQDGDALVAAATALDDVDAVAVKGDRKAARDRRPAAARATQTAGEVVRRLDKDVAAYERAVAALDAAAAPGLTPEQLEAISDAAAAGRAEVAELRRYAAAVTSVWTRYEELDADQKLWVSRAYNGWYRTTEESAAAYVVLTDRRRLATTRRTFAAADERRVAAARTASRAFQRTRAALASLLS